MNALLEKAKAIQAEPCVSIIMNTHRSKPDNLQDAVLLKKMIRSAELRLQKEYDPRRIEPVVKNLNNLAETFDHTHNLESLIVYANGDFVDYTRLPLAVQDRVVIDKTFATRDIVRAINREHAYYVLVLSRQQARLIKAFNDSVVEEFSGKFPLLNVHYLGNQNPPSTSKGQDKVIEEFFNIVDKTVSATIRDHVLPIILVTETHNCDHYKKIADHFDLFAGYLNQNRDEQQAHQIVHDSWAVMEKIIQEKNAKRKIELNEAVSAGKLVSDYNDIWRAIQEGKGKTLFVKRGLFQSAMLIGNIISLVDQSQREQKGVVDDIVDEMIEKNSSFGGETVFMDEDELDEFHNIALVTRY